MGFRCPGCHTDFGIDRAAFARHLAHCGTGQAIATLVLAATNHQALLHELLGAAATDPDCSPAVSDVRNAARPGLPVDPFS